MRISYYYIRWSVINISPRAIENQMVLFWCAILWISLLLLLYLYFVYLLISSKTKREKTQNFPLSCFFTCPVNVPSAGSLFACARSSQAEKKEIIIRLVHEGKEGLLHFGRKCREKNQTNQAVSGIRQILITFYLFLYSIFFLCRWRFFISNKLTM